MSVSMSAMCPLDHMQLEDTTMQDTKRRYRRQSRNGATTATPLASPSVWETSFGVVLASPLGPRDYSETQFAASADQGAGMPQAKIVSGHGLSERLASQLLLERLHKVPPVAEKPLVRLRLPPGVIVLGDALYRADIVGHLAVVQYLSI